MCETGETIVHHPILSSGQTDVFCKTGNDSIAVSHCCPHQLLFRGRLPPEMEVPFPTLMANLKSLSGANEMSM